MTISKITGGSYCPHLHSTSSRVLKCALLVSSLAKGLAQNDEARENLLEMDWPMLHLMTVGCIFFGIFIYHSVPKEFKRLT